MASQLYEGGIFQQSAVPWWLAFKQDPNSEYANDFQFYDKTTGKRVYQDASGNFFYDLPRAERYDVGEDGQWKITPGSAGVAVPDSLMTSSPQAADVLGASGVNGLARIRLADGTVTTGTQLQGDASDYAKLFEGMVPGSPGYMQVAGGGTGAGTQVVRGSDGNLYAAQPSDARFAAAIPDNSGFMSNFVSGYAPLIMAALPFTGVGSALAGAFGNGIGGQMASRAVMNAGTSLLTGGDPIRSAISGAVSAGVGAAMPGFETGLGAPIDSALKGALTGGTVSALQGGNPLAGAIAGGGSSLFSSGMKSAASAGRDLVSNFSANPSPSTAVDTLAANTTGPNPAQAWGNSVDNMDSFLGQFAASPSPATADQTISGLSQQTAGQTSSGPFQQPASSLPWQTVSSNNYLQNPVTGGGNMAFFDEILGDYTVDPSQFWPTTGSMDTGGDYSSTSLFDPSGTAAANYLDYGMTYAPGGLNLGYTQDLSNSGNFIPDTASGGWDSFLKSMGASGIGQAASSIGKGLTTGISALGGRSILGTGLSIAPALAAINYATNQPGFDTSKLQSVYDQYNPSAQTGLYDIASQQQMSKLQSDLERRGVSGSSFGDQSIATQNTVRDLGRNALINQGLGGQAEIAAKMLDAQAKERAARNQLYGSALYSLGSALSPRNPMMG